MLCALFVHVLMLEIWLFRQRMFSCLFFYLRAISQNNNNQVDKNNNHHTSNVIFQLNQIFSPINKTACLQRARHMRTWLWTHSQKIADSVYHAPWPSQKWRYSFFEIQFAKYTFVSSVYADKCVYRSMHSLSWWMSYSSYIVSLDSLIYIFLIMTNRLTRDNATTSLTGLLFTTTQQACVFFVGGFATSWLQKTYFSRIWQVILFFLNVFSTHKTTSKPFSRIHP